MIFIRKGSKHIRNKNKRNWTVEHPLTQNNPPDCVYGEVFQVLSNSAYKKNYTPEWNVSFKAA